MKHAKIKIYGQVQKVGFRYAAKVEAEELNLTGYVENGYDGTVNIEAEGREEDLEQFIEWCRKGPRWAVVSDAVYNLEDELNNFMSFDIKIN